jgi:hypothetical protein
VLQRITLLQWHNVAVGCFNRIYQYEYTTPFTPQKCESVYSLEFVHEQPDTHNQNSITTTETLSNKSFKLCIRRQDKAFINHFISNDKKQNTSEKKPTNSKKRVAESDTVVSSVGEEEDDITKNFKKKRSKHEKKQKKNKLQEIVNKHHVERNHSFANQSIPIEKSSSIEKQILEKSVNKIDFDLENELDTCFETIQKDNVHDQEESLRFIEKIKSDLKDYQANNTNNCSSDDLFIAKLTEEINHSILNDLWLEIRENVFKKFTEKHNCQLYCKIFDKLFHKGKLATKESNESLDRIEKSDFEEIISTTLVSSSLSDRIQPNSVEADFYNENSLSFNNTPELTRIVDFLNEEFKEEFKNPNVTHHLIEEDSIIYELTDNEKIIFENIVNKTKKKYNLMVNSVMHLHHIIFTNVYFYVLCDTTA